MADHDTVSPWESRANEARSIVANMRSPTEIDRTVPRGFGAYVYLAYSAGRIKIGTSREVKSRHRGLNTQSPHPVTVILAVPGGTELERKLHDCLGSLRVHGEWFSITRDMRRLLKLRLCKSGMRKFKQAEADFRKWLADEGYTRANR
ncbi:GIY-YIG nuclease family protein [Bradyrhizobium sp. USDA 4545]|uniref:GIY-YIG nuclease family protein n=1 Tax=Bradyrhizobium sp. USDA 4545 TaxID=2817705 RepID=UPI0020A3638C|nr:GIY-YIG nuclease family protein [Bradyrhizobium sp. USDA 4545]MCP1832864.1 hypothetical protein [Bradyrhizobium sp. USDA 4545]